MNLRFNHEDQVIVHSKKLMRTMLNCTEKCMNAWSPSLKNFECMITQSLRLFLSAVSSSTRSASYKTQTWKIVEICKKRLDVFTIFEFMVTWFMIKNSDSLSPILWDDAQVNRGQFKVQTLCTKSFMARRDRFNALASNSL